MFSTKFTKIYFTSIISILLGFFTSGLSQQEINYQKLNRDINIMEGILNKLLNDNYTHSNIDTKGLYVSNFGLVFHTNPVGYRLGGPFLYSYKQSQKLLKEMKRNLLELEKTTPKTPSTTETYKKIIKSLEKEYSKNNNEQIQKALKGNILLFFQNYASAIGQLKPQDKIVVLVNLRNSKLADSGETFLSGWIMKKDIDELRQHRINTLDFKKRVHFQVSDGQTDIIRDVSVMTEIFDRGIETSLLFDDYSSSGIYLKGLGALFFIDATRTIWSNLKNNPFTVGSTKKSGIPSITVTKKTNKKKKETNKEYLQKLQENLFELLSSYGHTLRLKPNEWIVINVDIENNSFFSGGEEIPSHFTIQVSKKDVDDYDRGILSLKELRRRIILRTF